MRNRIEVSEVAATRERLASKKFKPAIEPLYRWRDWAAKSGGITGNSRLPLLTLRNSRREEAKTEKSEIRNQDLVRAGHLGCYNRIL